MFGQKRKEGGVAQARFYLEIRTCVWEQEALADVQTLFWIFLPAWAGAETAGWGSGAGSPSSRYFRLRFEAGNYRKFSKSFSRSSFVARNRKAGEMVRARFYHAICVCVSKQETLAYDQNMRVCFPRFVTVCEFRPAPWSQSSWLLRGFRARHSEGNQGEFVFGIGVGWAMLRAT